MSNVTVYYYDPRNANQYSGWGETYEVVPHSTLLAPAFREADDQHRYEYRFDGTTEQWQEIAIAHPVQETEPEAPALDAREGGEAVETDEEAGNESSNLQEGADPDTLEED